MIDDVLRTAIVSRFDATPNDFHTAVGGRLAYVRGHHSWENNYSVFSFPSGLGSANTMRDATIFDSDVQFSCFSSTSSGASDIALKCHDHFHRETLSSSGIENFKLTYSHGISPIPAGGDVGLWMAAVIFEFMVQRA